MTCFCFLSSYFWDDACAAADDPQAGLYWQCLVLCQDLLSSLEVLQARRSAVGSVSVVAMWTGAPIMWGAAMGRSMEGSWIVPVVLMLAIAPITVVTRMGLRVAESGPVPVVVVRMPGVTGSPRGGSPIPVPVVSSVMGWCTWWQYLVWAVHCYMSIIIAIIAPYVWTIACHVANFLALKAPIIIAWHCVNWWGR